VMTLTVTRRNRLIVATLAIVALAATWYWTATSSAQVRSSPPTAVVPVETAIARSADLPVYLDALGTVKAFNTATITSRVDGQLDKLNFVEGQDVHAGDALAQIDPRPFQSQLAQAEAKKAQDEAQLANAQRDVQRYLMLAPEDYASKQTLDATRSLVAQLSAQIKSDHAAIDGAKTQLAYTSISAPFSGRTGIRMVDEGNIVRASDTSGIVVITQLQPISVIFTLPQDDLLDVSSAMAAGQVLATALSSDGKTELDKGTLTLIDNVIDTSTGTVRLKATFPNQDRKLWPGQFVNVRLLMRTLPHVLTVPSDAISRGPNGAFTYVVKNDTTVEMRPLDVGRDTDGITQIENGLKEGERVVTSGQYRLQQDAHVQVRVAQVVAPGAAR
jgi:multidrug efflux system membrane fusion protein